MLEITDTGPLWGSSPEWLKKHIGTSSSNLGFVSVPMSPDVPLPLHPFSRAKKFRAEGDRPQQADAFLTQV